jgi:hypothetical protein
MYATPAGKAMLQRTDQSRFTITVGTGHLGRTDLTKAPPGTIVWGGQTRVEGGNTRYGTVEIDGHKASVAKSPDSPTAPPIQVIIDKDQSAEIGKDPARVFAHEFGGHTADVLNTAEGNPNQFIDGVKPKDETSSEAAEKALGKVPNQPSEEDLKAVEQILKLRNRRRKKKNHNETPAKVAPMLARLYSKCRGCPDLCAPSGRGSTCFVPTQPPLVSAFDEPPNGVARIHLLCLAAKAGVE